MWDIRNEGNVLFNDALNTFYLRLYATNETKEMVYLTMHSTHFIYGYMQPTKRNGLFNDALNTFYLQLYATNERNVSFNDALNTFYLRLYATNERRKCFI